MEGDNENGVFSQRLQLMVGSSRFVIEVLVSFSTYVAITPKTGKISRKASA